MVEVERKEALAAVVGKTVTGASSSLGEMAIGLDGPEGPSGVILEAGSEGGAAIVQARLVSVDELPSLAEAVCAVDWSWIEKSVIKNAEPAGSSVKFQLDPAGPLTIGAAFWQGKPFLSFQPYRPAKK